MTTETKTFRERIKAFDKDLKKLHRLLVNIRGEHSELMNKDYDNTLLECQYNTKLIRNCITEHKKEMEHILKQKY